ncbi:MAG TPA: lipopolysaccharide biosynthesis protein [Actinomycetes bacterium]|nr:lipopolysaccharide biosynthesis protein [Actinomycetes bacterium]
MRWSFVGLTSKIVAQTLTAIVLARLVGPEVYGLIGLTTVYAMLMSLLLTQGMSLAIVRMEHPTDRDFGTVNLASQSAAIALGAATVVLAPTLARFFDAPEMRSVLYVLAIGLCLKALAILPLARLMRSVEFQLIARAEVVSSGVGAVVGIAVAALGGGVWAYVVLVLVTDALFFVLLWNHERDMPWRGSWRSLIELYSFALTVTATQLLGFAARNVDNLLIARFLGPTALGFYAVSYRFMRMPITSLVMIVNRALYPLFSAYREDRRRLSRNFLVATSAMSLISWPLMVVVIVFAEEIVLTLFGSDWLGAVTPTQILAAAAIAQTLSSMMTPAMLATGHERAQLYWTIAITTTLTISFFFTAQHGINAVAAAYTVVTLLFLPWAVVLMGRAAYFTPLRYLRALIPSALVAISVGVLGLLAKEVLGTWLELGPLVTAVVGSTLAGALTAAWAAPLLRRQMSEELSLLQRVVRLRRSPSRDEQQQLPADANQS